MDVNTVRRANLQRLVQEAGSIKAFAEKVGTDASYISAVLSTNIGRNAGDQLMRRVEKAYKLESGSLDFPEETSLAAALALAAMPEDVREETLAYIDYRLTTAGIANEPAAAEYLKMRQSTRKPSPAPSPKKFT